MAPVIGVATEELFEITLSASAVMFFGAGTWLGAPL